MDFDSPKVYGDTSISDGLVFWEANNHNCQNCQQFPTYCRLGIYCIIFFLSIIAIHIFLSLGFPHWTDFKQTIMFLALDNMIQTPGSIFWIVVQTIVHWYGVHWRSGHFITFEITMTIIFEILSGMHLLHSSLYCTPVLAAVCSIRRFDFHTWLIVTQAFFMTWFIQFQFQVP